MVRNLTSKKPAQPSLYLYTSASGTCESIACFFQIFLVNKPIDQSAITTAHKAKLFLITDSSSVLVVRDV